MRGSAGSLWRSRLLGQGGLLAAALLMLPIAQAQLFGPDVVQPPAVLKTPKDVLDRWLKVDCSYPGPTETYRECVQIVASRLPKLDESRRHHFGERYSPKEYLTCRLGTSHGNTRCDVHALRRIVNPTYWPMPNVPMPAFPAAPKDDVYREWMRSDEYFAALCKAEAGEFIYKVAADVSSVYLIRPRALELDIAMQDRFVVEDPYGYDEWQARNPYSGFLSGAKYEFVEVPDSAGDPSVPVKVRRYFRSSDPKSSEASYDTLDAPTSNFGILWRGISRPTDRHHRIAGGELLVIDLRNGELIAVKRGFAIGGPVKRSPTRTYWPSSKLCPGDSSRIYRLPEFLVKVLAPSTKRSRP